MKHFFLFVALLLTCAAVSAQPGMRRGGPRINDDLSVSFLVQAPQAREVSVDIGNKV